MVGDCFFVYCIWVGDYYFLLVVGFNLDFMVELQVLEDLFVYKRFKVRDRYE